MNCKPGDLAVRVCAPSGASIPAGAIVRCVNNVGESPVQTGETSSIRFVADLWHVEFRGARFAPNGQRWAVCDAELRPIRDNDGEDEMLRIAGKPQSIKTPEAA